MKRILLLVTALVSFGTLYSQNVNYTVEIVEYYAADSPCTEDGLGFGFDEEITIDDIHRDSIENFNPTEPPKGSIKRIATVWKDSNGFSSRLDLKDLSLNNFLAKAEGEEAHAVFDFDDGDQYRIRGKGAGRWPTTESVMADLFDISALDL